MCSTDSHKTPRRAGSPIGRSSRGTPVRWATHPNGHSENYPHLPTATSNSRTCCVNLNKNSVKPPCTDLRTQKPWSASLAPSLLSECRMLLSAASLAAYRGNRPAPTKSSRSRGVTIGREGGCAQEHPTLAE